MTPVDQEFIHDPDNGVYGDCQRAVIASLMDLPLVEVPHFLRDAKGHTHTFFKLLQTFCLFKGYVYATSRGAPLLTYGASDIAVYHEIAGMSPRGVYHAVVACNGEIVHDPHPSRAGLIGAPNEWEYSYLISVKK